MLPLVPPIAHLPLGHHPKPPKTTQNTLPPTSQTLMLALSLRYEAWIYGTLIPIPSTKKHVDVAIRKFVRHPDFSIRTGTNNVALLFLRKPLQLTRHINIICLPPPHRNFLRNRCFVSGWCKKNIEDHKYMNIMKKIEVPIVDSFTCERQLQEPYSFHFRLHNSLMCAGGEIG
ncbi:hypothetical protein M5D96_003979 [Drosophila gunungcola]|uniref:Peptidase S1 domain-containing protein n=1 Tax=Drosophila gunungcola TaxID=103775 RepID=A0A9Q0BS28_9MUSC|nr:hypothetical protein M5D96_003979 [Drosophila gunungcola]